MGRSPGHGHRWGRARISPMPWVLDLDGVVYLADQVIPGAAAGVARLRGAGGRVGFVTHNSAAPRGQGEGQLGGLRAAGERVVFVTNNSAAPRSQVEAKLGGFGIDAAGDVVTSAMVAATL